MISLQTILSYVMIGANRKEIYHWHREMTTVRADRTQSKKGTLSDCEKDPRKHKGPVTSVTLKHEVVLRLCFCFPSVCSGQNWVHSRIFVTTDYSYLFVCFYEQTKQNMFSHVWLICHMLFVLVIVGLNHRTLFSLQL